MDRQLNIQGTLTARAVQERLKRRRPSINKCDSAESALVLFEQLIELDLLPEVEKLIQRRRRLADTLNEAAQAVEQAA